MLSQNEMLLLIWAAVMVLALIVEAATPMLVSLWFSLGALLAIGAAWLGASLTTQVIVFLFVSIAALLLARPMARRWLDPHIVPTNADRLLGTQGRVTELIDNDHPCGAVYADGKTWTARSEDGSTIPVGETVEILRMEGVKLIVRLPAEGCVPCALSSNHR